ncbi:hypothetical protein IEO21_10253 [Rhodonia placenta]|uniref:Uncharacterized protein n=1 Tax=Rhodonia placenta TaxID=104341 RepID=A0A8H7TXG9_9APHY|nr:hypothetical protein IEO21_10253 [Postia placenta]
MHPGHKVLRPASMQPLEKKTSLATATAAGRKGTSAMVASGST